MQPSFVPSKDSCPSDGLSHLGSDTTTSSPTFFPKPPAKDLLRRTHSNPEDIESRRLPSLRIGKTMRMPGLAVASQLGGPIPRTNDLSSRLRLTKIPVKAVDPVENVIHNTKHKKLERSQTAPVALLKPIKKANPEDFRGKTIMCMSPASEKPPHFFTCRKISEEGEYKVGLDSCEVSEQRISSPIMRVLPNGRKITSRTSQQRSALINSEMVKPNTSAQSTPSRNDKPRNERETLNAKCQNEVVEHKACDKLQGRKDGDAGLTYLTFAKERQEENNRI